MTELEQIEAEVAEIHATAEEGRARLLVLVAQRDRLLIDETLERLSKAIPSQATQDAIAHYQKARDASGSRISVPAATLKYKAGP